MDCEKLRISDVWLLTPKKYEDGRGFFSEVYNKRRYLERQIGLDFVQDNHSMSREPGTIRGLHFQSPPMAQDKLLRVTRGAVFDVAVDLRKGSPTYGEWVSAVVSAKSWGQMLVPIGFAHGFCTLEPDTEVLYKVTNYHAPDHELGVRWDDPDLAIDWPVAAGKAVLSDRDRALPYLSEVVSPFDY